MSEPYSPTTKLRHAPPAQTRRQQHRPGAPTKRAKSSSSAGKPQGSVGASAQPKLSAQAILAAFGDELPIGLALIGPAGAIDALNPPVEALLHISASDLIGEQAQALLDGIARLARDPVQAETQLAALHARAQREHATMLIETSLIAPPLSIDAFPLASAASPGGRAILITPTTSTVAQSAAPSDALFAALAQRLRETLTHMQTEATSLTAPARRWDATALYQIGHALATEAHGVQEALETSAKLRELHAYPAPLRLSPVELDAVMMTLIPRWQEQAPYHTFELALPGELPAVSADKTRVEEALDILLEYAVALAPAGGTVRVDIRPHVEEVAVSIRSQGYRIPPEEIERIGEPFHSMPGQPEISVRGGLGLTLVEAILATHGGTLRAEAPASGPGSVLIATWPVVPVALARVTQAPPTQPTPMPGAEIAPVTAPPPTRLTTPRARQVALVYDSDPRMLRYLRANLDAQRYRTLVASDLAEAERLIELEEPDLLLLDTRCEEGDGADALRRMRDLTSAPILTLTRRHDPDECARLLDLGAVDYIVKPFSMEELLARVRVALRTHEAQLQATAREPVFQSGELAIDFAQRSVTLAGSPIALSKTEFKLLRSLAQHAGMVLSHEALLETVWGPAYLSEIEFVWVYIRRLRRKIEPDPSHPRYIQTVPGVGYRLERVIS